jgi:hypothetical protein
MRSNQLSYLAISFLRLQMYGFFFYFPTDTSKNTKQIYASFRANKIVQNRAKKRNYCFILVFETAIY